MDASALYQHSLKNIAGEYIALLIGQYGSDAYPDQRTQEESLEELHQLCDTAGVRNMQSIFVKVFNPNPASFINETLIERVRNTIREDGVNLVVIDANLRANQLSYLEDTLKVRVLGRIEIILDIFAMRAQTKASSLQVELAQLTYILPRLKGLGGVLSRLGGGIGTRGPGETMLETDRRHVRKRIQKIKDELENVKTHQANTRKNRHLPAFALVGYTNAGKSTLMNQLASSPRKVLAEDRLFATLDSSSRKVYLGDMDYRPLYGILSDTVGFIRNLPASLIAAFESTLDEIRFTDVLIIVVDASSFQIYDEIKVVESEIERLHISDKPRILYFNKEDLVFPETRERLASEFPDAVWGSALSKDGVERIREKLYQYTLEKYIPAIKDASVSKKMNLY